MRSEILSLIFSLVLLLGSATNIKGKSLPNLQKNQTEIGNIRKNNQGNLRKLNNYDTYITIYFKEDVTYSSGFNNDYRSDINYIINTKDKTKQLNKETTLNINKDYGIEIHFGAKVTKLSDFFSKNYDENMQYLISVDFSNFDSSSLSYIDRLFLGCNSLKSIDFSNFNSSLVENMGSMFKDCTSLESLNLKNFNTFSLNIMSSMFVGCSSLKTIDISSFDTSKVKYMDSLFAGCTSLKEIDFSSFNTYKVLTMNSMFYDCSSLELLYLSNFNTHSVAIWALCSMNVNL